MDSFDLFVFKLKLLIFSVLFIWLVKVLVLDRLRFKSMVL